MAGGAGPRSLRNLIRHGAGGGTDGPNGTTSLDAPLAARRQRRHSGRGAPRSWHDRRDASASGTAECHPQLAIDLIAEPPTLDPALVYDSDGWSVIHSIYDALVQLGPNGTLQMVLAESMTQIDPKAWEVKLRPEVTFHNGETLDAAAVAFSVAHILDPSTQSQIAGSLQVIEDVEQVDPLTVRFHLSAPAPWLPSQMAPWLAILPPMYAGDQANDFAANPVGTGPYGSCAGIAARGWRLERNDDYFTDSAKGQPIAARRAIPVRAGRHDASQRHRLRHQPARARRALRRAGSGRRVGRRRRPADRRVRVRAHPDRRGAVRQRAGAPGDELRCRRRYDHRQPPGGERPSLGRTSSCQADSGSTIRSRPYAYDPELAKKLLSDAGYPDGFSTTLAYTIGERDDLVSAIARATGGGRDRRRGRAGRDGDIQRQLAGPERGAAAVSSPGARCTIRTRCSSLVVSNKGFLSRYDNPDAQTLIEAGAIEHGSRRDGMHLSAARTGAARRASRDLSLESDVVLWRERTGARVDAAPR